MSSTLTSSPATSYGTRPAAYRSLPLPSIRSSSCSAVCPGSPSLPIWPSGLLIHTHLTLGSSRDIHSNANSNWRCAVILGNQYTETGSGVYGAAREPVSFSQTLFGGSFGNGLAGYNCIPCPAELEAGTGNVSSCYLINLSEIVCEGYHEFSKLLRPMLVDVVRLELELKLRRSQAYRSWEPFLWKMIILIEIHIIRYQ